MTKQPRLPLAALLCLLAALLCLLAAGACEQRTPQPPVAPPRIEQEPATTGARARVRRRAMRAPAPKPAAARPPTPWRAGAIAHGGVGSSPALSDGCRAAVDRALAVLKAGADPLDAAVAGVRVLEDDPRYNAGTGSRVRLDGVTVQMDAAVMDSRGRFGAVAVIEQVRNPVRVARAVVDTPHRLLAGDGATRFARALGLAPFDPATPEMRAAATVLRAKLLARDPALPREWRAFDWRRHWNFAAPPPGAAPHTGPSTGPATAPPRRAAPAPLRPPASPMAMGSDTVGVAVRSADGRFAVALSTGGTSVTLRGRVGDVPILGAGLYAGPRGAVAATGTGERIVEQLTARSVHELLERGVGPYVAARQAIARIRGRGAIGLIVITPQEMTGAADRPMAWAAREAGSGRWLGPPTDKARARPPGRACQGARPGPRAGAP